MGPDRGAAAGQSGPVVLSQPRVDGLSEVVRSLREWQLEGAPVPLHPGDLGWYWRFGADATAAATRTWSRAGAILAVGLLDGPDLVRLAIRPDAQADEQLARQMLVDLNEAGHGVLPRGSADIEVRAGELLRRLLLAHGWENGEPWAPLSRPLTDPVEDGGVRVSLIGPQSAGVRVALQRASFENSTFTEERWHAMAAGLPYSQARCLLAYDGDTPVAAATVWSAGPGRPGLLEPMGVHREHRGRGHGRAITLAAAGALRDLGSSNATVCTASSNVAAVATYRSAGFRPLPEVRDLHRPG